MDGVAPAVDDTAAVVTTVSAAAAMADLVATVAGAIAVMTGVVVAAAETVSANWLEGLSVGLRVSQSLLRLYVLSKGLLVCLKIRLSVRWLVQLPLRLVVVTAVGVADSVAEDYAAVTPWLKFGLSV